MKPVINAAIGVVHRGSKILICQRKAGDTLGGYWEFPGGKQEAGETHEDCLQRELREELAIDVTILQRLATIEHEYPRALIRLHPLFCRLEMGEPQPLESDDMRWIEPAQLPSFQFPPANEVLFAEIVRVMDAL